MPAQLGVLLTQARLAALARAAGVSDVAAGPRAIALTVTAGRGASYRNSLGKLAEGSRSKGDRLIVPLASEVGPQRLLLVERLLTTMAS